MTRKPQLHDSTDTVDPDKNRLEEIASSVEPDDNWQGFHNYFQHNHHKQRDK